MHQTIVNRCFEVMSDNLHQDICRLVLPGTLSEDVPTETVEQSIPPYLRYACCHWIGHIGKLVFDGQGADEVGFTDGGQVHMFFLENLLFWLEAMCFIQDYLVTAHITFKAAYWIKVSFPFDAYTRSNN